MISIRLYQKSDFDELYKIIHQTIDGIYPKYYPNEAVKFFHKHHSKENLEKDLEKAKVFVVISNNKIVGTGTLIDTEIKRVFVLPKKLLFSLTIIVFPSIFGKY